MERSQQTAGSNVTEPTVLWPLGHYDVSGDVNQTDNTLGLVANRQDTGLSSTATLVTVLGQADRVYLAADVYMTNTQNTAFARIAPELLLQKLISGSWVTVARGASGYQRHTTGHRASSLHARWIDPNPSVDQQYRLQGFQGGNQNDVLNINLGTFTVEAKG